MVRVQQWAEIRRMHEVEGLSIRAINRRTGVHRKTITRALESPEPPRYSRAGSKLDPFKSAPAGMSRPATRRNVSAVGSRSVHRCHSRRASSPVA